MTAWTLPALAALPLILALIARLHGAGLIGWTVSALAYAAGHGTVYGMVGYSSPNDPTRIERLERIVRPVYQALGGDIRQPAYSWAVMGLKGLLIGLPTGPGALALAVLWPASYWIGRRAEANLNEVAEYLSGCAAGCVVLGVVLAL